jgi:hypothetical protein
MAWERTVRNARHQLSISVLLVAALSAGACRGRQEETARIRIDVSQGEPGIQYINGYQKTVSGQVLAYHSSHPDADSALLVRANTEVNSIAWLTDPLPADYRGDFYNLVWLAGLERQGWPGNEVHSFDFLINGDHWFTFRNLKDSGAMKWAVAGKQGAELSFESVIADRAGDLFGYMFLRIPRGEFKPGVPLTLQVRGQDAGSLDWYMTLQYPFRFTPALRAEPALVREGAETKQLVRLSLDNLHQGRSLEIRVTGARPVRQPVKVGANIVYLAIPAAGSQKKIPVDFNINGVAAGQPPLELKPVNRREIHLLSYSHTDIGYTDLQPVIEARQRENLERALRLIRQTRAYPPEARYRWNLEVMWPLEGYLKGASEQKRQELVQAVRDGYIGLNALYANVLTGLATAGEMSRFTGFAGSIARQYGVPVTTALVSDIPGFTWGLVPALAHSGVKYFASAPNAGDRIGHVLEKWGDRPFYWASQSGEEKVLTWVAGASYSSFHEGDLTRLGDEKILKLMRRLDDASYPYEILQLPYTIGGDNGPPDPRLPDFVKVWNDRYESPRLILATHAQMFAEFERRYGSSLPTFQGDFTPYWEDGAASSAAETALNRRAADRLVQGEALWAMLAPGSYPAGDYDVAWRNIILWDEHTWGAHNSVSDPDLPSVKEQWRIKRQFALDADRMSQALLLRLPGRQAGAQAPLGETAIDICNTHSWPRTDVVFLPATQAKIGDAVFDDKGNALPSQRISTGELAVRVEDVPPLSARRIVVRPGKALNQGNCRATGTALSNSLLSVSLDPGTGVIRSLLVQGRQVELVDRLQYAGLNQYLYVAGKDPREARSLSGVRIRVKESGSLVASLLVEAQAPGCAGYGAEIRLLDGIGRVDIIHAIDKLAVRTKEAVHVAFPFQVPGGQLRYDVAYGIVRPEADQLPGSCKNFFSLQSWADVSNADSGVTWASPDAPLIEIGSITAEQPWAQATASATTLYSYLMNNYWHTNYKADQEGPASFRYSILPHGSFVPEEAVRFGRDMREPLLALPADPASSVQAPLFLLQPPQVLVSSIRPLGQDAWLVCLYNPSEGARDAAFAWNRLATPGVYASDSFGRKGEKLGATVKVAARGSRYVRLETK